MTVGRPVHRIPRSVTTVSPFDSNIDLASTINNEFLDTDMNDCPIENISEDQQSDESEGSEASEFEIAQDE